MLETIVTPRDKYLAVLDASNHSNSKGQIFGIVLDANNHSNPKGQIFSIMLDASNHSNSKGQYLGTRT